MNITNPFKRILQTHGSDCDADPFEASVEGGTDGIGQDIYDRHLGFESTILKNKFALEE